MIALLLFAWLAPAAEPPPNVVLVFADDMGYGDLGCYGNAKIRTPNLDRLAREGVRATDFYVAQAVCSSSRCALLTGCYPNRIGVVGALGPASKNGLKADDPNLAATLRARGYATAAFGKWHLGSQPEFLPTNRGFDRFYGLPYSNDMWPKHPSQPQLYPPLPLYEQDRVVATMPAQEGLTAEYTRRAVAFIEEARDRPFFLYLPHTFPHVPLFAGARFRGKSPGGLYGDVVEEIDDSVGQVLAALKRTGVAGRTLVIFASDNGPWLPYGNHAGSTGGLRAGKGSAFDGGVRVPFLARWPGRIPAGATLREPAMTIDLFPTLAKYCGAALPAGKALDGRDIAPLLEGVPNAKSPHAAYAFYWLRELHAVRAGRWKMHWPHTYPLPKTAGADGTPGPVRTATIGKALFDLAADPNETTDVAAANPEVVARLDALGDGFRRDLGDDLRPVAAGKKGR